MINKDIIATIGATPLVKLRLDDQARGTVYAKLELQNPFGMKDRVAKRIVLEARRRGLLAPGASIIESSSGTMALGLALVGTYLNHPVHIVTDPRIDALTYTKLQALGCHVHIVEKMSAQGWQSARLERLQELLQLYPEAFWPRQYENPDNPYAYEDLADELLQDLGQVDVLVGSVGSGGSLCGTARALINRQRSVHTVAVDAIGSAIFDQPDRPTRLQSGLGNSLVPFNVDRGVIDEVHWLNDAEAFAATLELASHEKIFAGNSSGSVYAVARWLSHQMPAGTTIVGIFPDRGDRYSGTIYNHEYRQARLEKVPFPSTPQEKPYAAVATSWSFSSLRQQEDTLYEHAVHTVVSTLKG